MFFIFLYTINDKTVSFKKRNSEKYPTFIGIGTQKGGTTWLYHQLRQHPDIWMPLNKELHYFDRNVKYPSPSHLTVERLSDRIIMAEGTQIRRLYKGIKNTVSAGVRRD